MLLLAKNYFKCEYDILFLGRSGTDVYIGARRKDLWYILVDGETFHSDIPNMVAGEPDDFSTTCLKSSASDNHMFRDKSCNSDPCHYICQYDSFP